MTQLRVAKVGWGASLGLPNLHVESAQTLTVGGTQIRTFYDVIA